MGGASWPEKQSCSVVDFALNTCIYPCDCAPYRVNTRHSNLLPPRGRISTTTGATRLCLWCIGSYLGQCTMVQPCRSLQHLARARAAVPKTYDLYTNCCASPYFIIVEDAALLYADSRARGLLEGRRGCRGGGTGQRDGPRERHREGEACLVLGGACLSHAGHHHAAVGGGGQARRLDLGQTNRRKGPWQLPKGVRARPKRQLQCWGEVWPSLSTSCHLAFAYGGSARGSRRERTVQV